MEQQAGARCSRCGATTTCTRARRASSSSWARGQTATPSRAANAPPAHPANRAAGCPRSRPCTRRSRTGAGGASRATATWVEAKWWRCSPPRAGACCSRRSWPSPPPRASRASRPPGAPARSLLLLAGSSSTRSSRPSRGGPTPRGCPRSPKSSTPAAAAAARRPRRGSGTSGRRRRRWRRAGRPRWALGCAWCWTRWPISRWRSSSRRAPGPAPARWRRRWPHSSRRPTG
mmetsp:Transcript_14337/g.33915  ORF Transcript_14337/g.33915 Transcript_14337/m.33915 type:complete len:231 (+) Transcript_14337:188-880(+)